MVVFLTIIAVGLFLSDRDNSPVLKLNSANVVMLTDGKTVETIPTDAKTVGQLLQRAHIRLNRGDVVEPSPQTQIIGENFRVNIYRAVPVTIVDGDQHTQVYSAATTARSIVQQAGVTVYPEDEVNLVPTSNFVTQGAIGEEVTIKRATPINLNLYGTPVPSRTQATTVAGVLTEKHIVLHSGDSVEPAPTTPITAGIQIFIIHKGTQIVTVQQSVPAPVQTVDDSSLSAGTTAVRQQGEAGEEAVTYQVQLVNGQQVSRTAIQTVVTQNPVPEIEAVGTAPLDTSLQQWLYKLRMCESGGNYQADTGNGFYGAYQFTYDTWNRMDTGYATANVAPPAVQDAAIVKNTLESSGGLATQNPGCYYKTGLSDFPPQ